MVRRRVERRAWRVSSRSSGERLRTYLPWRASFRRHPGTLPGNRKALTRTEASTTALFGIKASGLVDGSQNFGFLFLGRFAPGNADGFQQDRSALRNLRLEVVAFLQPSRFPYIPRQVDLGGAADLDERHERFS